jgi:5-methylthioadenosine/S-adenosylhomocysteine deaminase
VIVIDLNKPHLVPLYNPYSQVVYAAGGGDVETVIIEGRVVMGKRKLLTLDEEKLIRDVHAWAGRINSY